MSENEQNNKKKAPIGLIIGIIAGILVIAVIAIAIIAACVIIFFAATGLKKADKEPAEEYVSETGYEGAANGNEETEPAKEDTETASVKVVSKEQSYLKDGSKGVCREYGYDEYGNRISSVSYNANGEITATAENEYNEFGELTRNRIIKTDGTVQETIYEYDSNGNLIKTGTTDENGEISFWWEYDYDSNGRLARDRACNSNGMNEVRYRYEYDENGNPSKKTYIESDGEESSWYIYECDSKGNIIKSSYYFVLSGLSEWEETEYDENDNIIKRTYFYNSGLNFYGNEYEYDEEGNVIKNSEFSEKGDRGTTKTEYSYEDIYPEALPEREIDLSIYEGSFQAEEENLMIETASVSFEEDEERYRAYFENEYAVLAEDMYFNQYNLEMKYAYADLDKDGTDELVIGDEFGIFAVVTEVEGAYFVSEVNGWRIQHGPTRSEYIGNGCFAANESNGNNYGGESEVYILWKYENNMKLCGVLARLACSWSLEHTDENLSKWTLFEAKDENKLSKSSSSSKMKPDNSDYVYTEIDYGDNWENVLKDRFDFMVDSNSADGKMTFDFRPIPQ